MAIFQDNPGKPVPYQNSSILDFIGVKDDGGGGDNCNEKKRSEETQTLHAGCSKVEPKIFAPPQTPSRVRGTAKI